ncbi:MFS general substrate transporter [Phanerochaete sordida]|uniref:MFS general substrate transporter n=1 Tax=Phanerochaete sordida TaxID=48140 RepID=A0A9P3LF53_9APHY|nr:MFS general substrate transporter [Phanerochaete sordida]
MASIDTRSSQHDEKSASVVTTVEDGEVSPGGDALTGPTTRKGVRFWLIFVAICVSLFLSALEYTAVSVALPTIVHDLEGDDFVWVPSAYALASTALLPTTGGLAEIFGRRLSMLMSLGLFALGSALCGAAQNMNWLIAARAVQGAGGGGILAITSIIISDLVPLRERAIYNGFIGLVWAVACALGPVAGGGFTERGQWRWLFYLNLPLSGFAAVLVVAFLRLKTPAGSLREKLGRMDWIGNALITSSSSACVIGLTWGGVKYPWSSIHVLAPLVIGIAGIAFFFVYEALWAKNPLIPFTLVSNRTSLSGYIQTFIGPIICIAAIYFSPVYFQACRNAGPVRSGVEMFGYGLVVGPMLIATGVSIARTKAYRAQLWAAWGFTMLAMGLCSTLRVDTPLARAIGVWVLLGVGSGIYFAATYFPVLAPLPVAENAHALAFFAFCRSFAGVWGVTIGTAVLQTQLTKKLPPAFVAQFPGGVSIAYSIIPAIPTLPEPLQSEVKAAFAESVAVIWQVMIGIAGIGFLASLFMKGLPLHTQVDQKWGLEDTAKAQDGDVKDAAELEKGGNASM